MTVRKSLACLVKNYPVSDVGRTRTASAAKRKLLKLLDSKQSRFLEANCRETARLLRMIVPLVVAALRIVKEGNIPQDRDRDQDEKPTRPTSDYCIILPRTLRWQGMAQVEARLLRLLKYLLDAGHRPIPHDTIFRKVYEDEFKTSKSLVNDILQLNKHLLDVGFPWTYSARHEYVCRK